MDAMSYGMGQGVEAGLLTKVEEWMRRTWASEAFYPSWRLGVWTNPSSIIRRGLVEAVVEIAGWCRGGALLDLGCGAKPYKGLFCVDEYIGVDVLVSGHDHNRSDVDCFYDGISLPFESKSFDHVFSSEVLEHVFEPDIVLAEVRRVLKSGGILAMTTPFIWGEHEEPYDCARFTSFGIVSLLERAGFEVLVHQKKVVGVAAIAQLASVFIYRCAGNRGRFAQLLCLPTLIAPINVFGLLLGSVFGGGAFIYLTNVIVAKKVSD